LILELIYTQTYSSTHLLKYEYIQTQITLPTTNF